MFWGMLLKCVIKHLQFISSFACIYVSGMTDILNLIMKPDRKVSFIVAGHRFFDYEFMCCIRNVL